MPLGLIQPLSNKGQPLDNLGITFDMLHDLVHGGEEIGVDLGTNVGGRSCSLGATSSAGHLFACFFMKLVELPLAPPKPVARLIHGPHQLFAPPLHPFVKLLQGMAGSGERRRGTIQFRFCPPHADRQGRWRFCLSPGLLRCVSCCPERLQGWAVTICEALLFHVTYQLGMRLVYLFESPWICLLLCIPIVALIPPSVVIHAMTIVANLIVFGVIVRPPPRRHRSHWLNLRCLVLLIRHFDVVGLDPHSPRLHCLVTLVVNLGCRSRPRTCASGPVSLTPKHPPWRRGNPARGRHAVGAPCLLARAKARRLASAPGRGPLAPFTLSLVNNVLPPTLAAVSLPQEWASSVGSHRASVPTSALATSLVCPDPRSPLGLPFAEGPASAFPVSHTAHLRVGAVPTALKAALSLGSVRGKAATALPLPFPRAGSAAAAPLASAAALAATALRPAALGAHVAEQGQEELPRRVHVASSSATVLLPWSTSHPDMSAAAAGHAPVLRRVMRSEAGPRCVEAHQRAGLRTGTACPAMPRRLTEWPRDGSASSSAQHAGQARPAQRGEEDGPRQRRRQPRATAGRVLRATQMCAAQVVPIREQRGST